MGGQQLSLEEIIKIAAKFGAKAAMERLEQEKQHNVKVWHDRRLKNIKLLLVNYRDFKEFSANAIYSAEQAEDVIDIHDLMWDPHNRSDQIVESIKKSAIRTKIIMTHIDEMLSIYESICAKSKNPADKRRYKVIYDRYISDDNLSIDDIAKEQHVDPRTIYMDLDTAVDKMAKLIFGIDWAVGSNGNG